MLIKEYSDIDFSSVITPQEGLSFLAQHAMEYIEDYDWDENPCGDYESIPEYELEQYTIPLQVLIDRDTPTKPIYEHEYSDDMFYIIKSKCPMCDNYLHYSPNYCPNCGQHLDWNSEGEEYD